MIKFKEYDTNLGIDLHNFLKENHVLHRFLANVDKKRIKEINAYTTIAASIDHAFDWDKTIEGYDFWSNLASNAKQ